MTKSTADLEKFKNEINEQVSVDSTNAFFDEYKDFPKKSYGIVEINALPDDHRDFLTKRHGTVELDPLPSSDPLDPLNWSDLKKDIEIIMVAFQLFSAALMAAGIAPAFQSMSELYGVSMKQVSYLVGAQIACLGVFPLFWIPLMNVYGRRPFLALSAIACCALNIGGGFCTTYGQQMTTRILVAAFMSNGIVSSSVVADLTFSHERGKKNGWWSVAIIIATPCGPFFMGFVEYHVGTKWIYFTFAIINFLQFVGWLFSTETLYIRNPHTQRVRLGSSISKIRMVFGLYKMSDKQFKWCLFWKPLKQIGNFNVSMAVIGASVVKAYANIVLVVEIPQIFGSIYGLNAQQLSLQYIALIVGTIIGELAGPLSDWWMKRCIKARGKKVVVDRLWISYFGFLCVIVGMIVWGVYLDKAELNHWTISPLIGAGVAAAGNDIVATILISFAIDSDPRSAADVGLYINLARLLFGFIGTFYFANMFDTLRYAGSAGLMVGIIFIFGAVLMALTHILGLRRACKEV